MNTRKSKQTRWLVGCHSVKQNMVRASTFLLQEGVLVSSAHTRSTVAPMEPCRTQGPGEATVQEPNRSGILEELKDPKMYRKRTARSTREATTASPSLTLACLSSYSLKKDYKYITVWTNPAGFGSAPLRGCLTFRVQCLGHPWKVRDVQR